MHKLLLIFILVSTFTSASKAGQETGNGGFYNEMIYGELHGRIFYITELTLNKMIEDNGLVLKTEILLPAFKKFIEENKVHNNYLDKLKYVLTNNKENLYNDIINSSFKIGNCKLNSDLCTGNIPESDIIINSKRILSKKRAISVYEFIGLIAHEFTHHYVMDQDHPYYLFAKYIRTNLLFSIIDPYKIYY